MAAVNRSFKHSDGVIHPQLGFSQQSPNNLFTSSSEPVATEMESKSTKQQSLGDAGEQPSQESAATPEQKATAQTALIVSPLRALTCACMRNV